jgi:hypothetical protein
VIRDAIPAASDVGTRLYLRHLTSLNVVGM